MGPTSAAICSPPPASEVVGKGFVAIDGMALSEASLAACLSAVRGRAVARVRALVLEDRVAELASPVAFEAVGRLEAVGPVGGRSVARLSGPSRTEGPMRRGF
jgi:hypothetical protein